MIEAQISYHFFLGGRDLEMVTLAGLLAAEGVAFEDGRLAWGAKASDYGEDIAAALDRGETPVLVELEPDLAPDTAARCIWLDHHGAAAGADKPCALRQAFDLMGLPPERWSRHLALVAANDVGHIAGLLAAGATSAEVRSIRAADRAAQGVTAQEEDEAHAALKRGCAMPGYFRVELPHERSSILGDFTHPAYGGKPVGDMLVLSPQGLSWYGRGTAVRALAERFGGWWGGALPERGYWGQTRTLADTEQVEAFLARLA